MQRVGYCALESSSVYNLPVHYSAQSFNNLQTHVVSEFDCHSGSVTGQQCQRTDLDGNASDLPIWSQREVVQVKELEQKEDMHLPHHHSDL